MVLIEQISADGKVKGRCDANCYNAICPTCYCICGGRNHGKGLHKSIIDQTEIIIKQLQDENKDDLFKMQKYQIDLFGEIIPDKRGRLNER